MAWGAAATGTRAATGSVGQGLSLMQESPRRSALAGVPLVVLQHGPGAGRLLPGHTGRGARRLPPDRAGPDGRPRGRATWRSSPSTWPTVWRNPVLVFGDYYLAHTYQSVDGRPHRLRARSRQGLGARRARPAARARPSWCRPSARPSSATMPAYDLRSTTWPGRRHRRTMVGRRAHRWPRRGFTEDADFVVVAFGTPGRYVRYVAVQQLREEGLPVGFVRPITLWPVPDRGGRPRRPTAPGRSPSTRTITGQMIDDVRLPCSAGPRCTSSAA